MFQAGFDYLPGKSLGDFYRFRDAAFLGDESENVRAGGQVAAFFQRFDSQANRCFVRLRR